MKIKPHLYAWIGPDGEVRRATIRDGEKLDGFRMMTAREEASFVARSRIATKTPEQLRAAGRKGAETRRDGLRRQFRAAAWAFMASR